MPPEIDAEGIWQPIPEYDGYEVSADGRVRSWRSPGAGSVSRKTPKPVIQADHNGYRMVSVCQHKKNRKVLVHRLVLSAFVGPCPDGFQAGHINGIRYDNRIENLRWITAKENAADRNRHGTTSRRPGERHPMCKLKDCEIEDILRSRGVVRRKDVAAKYNIHPEYVYAIWSGRRRAHKEQGQ